MCSPDQSISPMLSVGLFGYFGDAIWRTGVTSCVGTPRMCIDTPQHSHGWLFMVNPERDHETNHSVPAGISA